jgi:endonuclease G, mitochondrial
MGTNKIDLAAAIRCRARRDARHARVSALAKLLLGSEVDPAAIEPVARQVQRARLLKREDLVIAGVGQDAATSKKLFEALIGPDDLLPRRFLDLGAAAARAVGRVVARISGGREYGTGSLVSSHHILTNNHVLPSPGAAASAVIELGYYDPGSGNASAVSQAFVLRPDDFFYTSEELDFTLVGVETHNGRASTLDYGRLQLIGESGKAVLGEKVNIVQHAGGQPQTISIRANTIVDEFDQYIQYAADTLPGSSGSPVFNDEWELVALHHASAPRELSGLQSGFVNEGIRVSAIVQTLSAALG